MLIGHHNRVRDHVVDRAPYLRWFVHLDGAVFFSALLLTFGR